MSVIAEYLTTISPTATTEPHLYPIDVSTYHRMGEVGILTPGERTELIDARIMMMVPIGSEHADWVDRLARFFIKTIPEDLTVHIQNPVHLDKYNEPQPDIALLRSRKQPYCDAHPRAEDVLLIIEVAGTSLNYDRQVKIPLYAHYGIAEVWLLDIRGNCLEIYQDPHEDNYRLMLKPRRHERITPMKLAAIEIDLSNFMK